MKTGTQFLGIRAGLWLICGVVWFTTIGTFRLLIRDSASDRAATIITDEDAEYREELPIKRTFALRKQRQSSVQFSPSGSQAEFELSNALEDDTPVEDLITRLASVSADVRAAAASALAIRRFAAANAIPVLRELAESDPEAFVRDRAKEALLNIRGFSAPPLDF